MSNKKEYELYIGFSSLATAFILITIMFFCSSCNAQNLAPQALEWDYNYVAWPESTIYIIIYSKTDADTSFAVLDTTGPNALEWSLIDNPHFYDFTWRTFYATAIKHYPEWADSLWSYESPPSNQVREYFKTLPPDGIDDNLSFRMIDLGTIP